MCAALLVRQMLLPLLSAVLQKVHHVLTEDDAVPPHTECSLILCTNGCFHSDRFVEQALEAAAREVRFTPVVAEENFHFPTKAFYEEVRRRPRIILKCCGTLKKCTAEDLVTAVNTIFHEIAIDVVLQDAEEIIATNVAAIAGRLREARSSRQVFYEPDTAPSMPKLTPTLHSSESSVSADQSSAETWSTVDLD